jgi:Tfp pilus assembly protein PilF
MACPTIDPTIYAIAINIIATGISAVLTKTGKKVFSPQDIVGYLNILSFSDILEDEIDFTDIPYSDIKNLDTFIVNEQILNIISQLYVDTEKSPTQIESEFVQVFCEIKPIGDRSTEEFGRKLFLCIRRASNVILHSKIMQGDLLAHEYKDQERHKEQRETLERIERYAASLYQVQTGAISSFLPTEKIDAELKESVDLINNRQYEKVKAKVFEVIGILKTASPENKKLLSKAYHLLAIAYNRDKQIGGNFDIAEQYANLSLEYDPSNDKAKGCLASIYINKHGKENFKKSFEISSPLWEKSDHTNPQFLEVYLWGLFFTKTAEDAINFFESSKKAQDLVEQNDLLSNVIARFYILLKNPKESLKHINNSIRVDKNNPDHYAIKANAYRQISLMEDWLLSDFEVCPRLKKNDCLEKAVINYQKCLSLCKEDRDLLLKESVKKELYSCSIILNRANQKEFFQIRFNINPSVLHEDEQKSLEFFDFIYELNCRNFSTAYTRLINLKDWDKFPYQTKVKIAVIFLRRGGPEESRKIFKLLESEAEKQKDIQIWINLSFIEALLDNKAGLFQQLEKAKRESAGSKDEEGVFGHIHAMVYRYRDSGKEIDRMITYLKEHDKKFPEQKLLKAIPINKKEEKPPSEIIDLFKDAIERDQKTKKIFTEYQVPSYILADIHRLTYPELMNRLKDPNFHLRYYPPDKGSQQEITKNFYYGEWFVFDYSSLLNLAKMDLLWELEKIPGKFSIPTSLFNQIQSDLVYYENSDLRKLWNFIRSTGKISIVDVDADPAKYEELLKYVNKWIVDTFELISSIEKSVLVSDDYNLIRLTKSQNCKGTTTLIFLRFLLDKGHIDTKLYGIALGVLADQMYIILPFDGEDLFHIVVDDNCKITLRSYHLINHISIPEVRPSAYTRQFDYFMNKLWKSGALAEEKIHWLSVITERMIFTINQRCEMSQTAEADIVMFDLKKIWGNIVSLCKLSDLATLEEKCTTLFAKDSSKSLDEYVRHLIKQRRAVFSEGNTQSSNH